MNDEVIQFLTEPDNLKAALDLQAIIQDVRAKVFDVFWDNVRRGLEKRSEASDPWRIRMGPPGFNSAADKGSWLGFVSQHDPEANKYSLVFGDLGGQESKNGLVYFGVKRGPLARACDGPVLDRVRCSFKKLGIEWKPDDYWVVYGYLSNIGSCITRTEDNAAVVKVNEDNQGPDHPLAKQTAELLWKAFLACRQDLEVLNDSSAEVSN